MKYFAGAVRLLVRINERWSVGKKILLSYFLLVLLPAGLLITYYYLKSSAIIEKEVTVSVLQALKQAQMNIAYRLNNIGNISNMILMNEELYNYLSRDARNASIKTQIDDAQELAKIIKNTQGNPDIFRVRLFADHSRLYTGERINFFPLDTLQKAGWLDNVLDNRGGIYWKSTYLEHYIDAGDIYVVSCARMIRNKYNYNDLAGVLIVDVSENVIYDFIAQLNFENKEDICIIDGNGKIVSYFDKSYIGRTIPDRDALSVMNRTTEGISKVGNGKEAHYLIYKSLGINDWKILANIPVSRITASNDAFNRISGAVIITVTLILFLLAIFLFAALLSEGVAKRIKYLISVMENDGLEGFNKSLPQKYGDIYRLEKNVDRMTGTLKKLMEESYQAKVNEREAQLKALQAQINPHFLYNALDTIHWMAMDKNADDISFMVESLAQYFRLSLSKGKGIVCISDELQLAKVYLDIQKSRFGDKFGVSFEIDGEINDFLIPKLTLQPVIENSLLHGILQRKGKKGFIRITAQKAGEDISLCVRDDGAGIEKSKLDGLLSESAESAGKSYGLFNVNERIRLFSGEGYGLSIFSEANTGTQVIIKIKAIKNP